MNNDVALNMKLKSSRSHMMPSIQARGKVMNCNGFEVKSCAGSSLGDGAPLQH